MQQNSISKSVSVANEDALIDRNSVLLTKCALRIDIKKYIYTFKLCLSWVKK